MSTGTQTGVVLAFLVAGWWYFPATPVSRPVVELIARNLPQGWYASVSGLPGSILAILDAGRVKPTAGLN